MLASDAVVQQWAGQGLPSDEHSTQNGILTTRASRFPLCIDPQEQAVNWIKRQEADHKMTIKTLNESDFMKHLELAIQFGNPFLFENVDEDIDLMLNPVLEKNTFRTGAQKMIQLGDKSVEWDDNFRLYFTTKLANPRYSPEIMGKTMLVNYSVTLDGLANQLLNVVVRNERPDLEEQYANLVEEMSANTQIIVELEDKLLHDLSHSQGNILDNEELIATLGDTKAKSTEINMKLEQSQFTKTEISKTRSGYTSVSKRGSILYFAVAGLSTIMKIYETSLNSFLSVFKGSLTRAKKDVVLDNRLQNLATKITEDMYDYTCTGIFEKHKLMFSFQMTCMIMNGAKT
jgi:dynein heavy chain